MSKSIKSLHEGLMISYPIQLSDFTLLETNFKDIERKITLSWMHELHSVFMGSSFKPGIDIYTYIYSVNQTLVL